MQITDIIQFAWVVLPGLHVTCRFSRLFPLKHENSYGLLDISFQKTTRWMSRLRRSGELRKQNIGKELMVPCFNKETYMLFVAMFCQEPLKLVAHNPRVFRPNDVDPRNTNTLSQTVFYTTQLWHRNAFTSNSFFISFFWFAAKRGCEESGSPWSSTKSKERSTPSWWLDKKDSKNPSQTRPSKQTKSAPKNKVYRRG